MPIIEVILLWRGYLMLIAAAYLLINDFSNSDFLKYKRVPR